MDHQATAKLIRVDNADHPGYERVIVEVDGRRYVGERYPLPTLAVDPLFFVLDAEGT